jgi:hypothetical protein
MERITEERIGVEHVLNRQAVEEIWPGVMPDQDDDLAQVLTNVKVNRLPPTRSSWANSWKTRAFLHLGLRLLYEHHSAADTPETGSGMHLIGNLTPENLANAAQRSVSDPDLAAQLSVVRWKETWGHRGAYLEDLVAYLFRPTPYVQRIERVRDAMVIDPGLRLNDFVRYVSDAEFDAAFSNPLYALQTWLQAAMPSHPSVSPCVVLLEDASLPLRGSLYQRAFSAYGLTLRDGLTWEDAADLSATLMKGAVLRGRARGEHPRLAAGDSTLHSGMLAMMSGWFSLPHDELMIRLPVRPGPVADADQDT